MGEPVSARKIAGTASVGKDTALKHLHGALSRLEYVTETGKGWVTGPADPREYDPVTDSMCGPILVKRDETYERHRRDHRAYLASRKKGKAGIDPETGERVNPCCPCCCMCESPEWLAELERRGERHIPMPGTVLVKATRGTATIGKPFTADRWYCAEHYPSYQAWEDSYRKCVSCRTREAFHDGRCYKCWSEVR